MRLEVRIVVSQASLDWHLVKKKISHKINVQRPDESVLLKYRDSHEPLTNYAEDHVLNTVSYTLMTSIIDQSPREVGSNDECLLLLLQR